MTNWRTPETLAAVQKLADIGDLAIEYVEAMEADWLEVKDPHETDDDLEPSWIAFRNEVRRLAAEARQLWPDMPAQQTRLHWTAGSDVVISDTGISHTEQCLARKREGRYHSACLCSCHDDSQR